MLMTPAGLDLGSAESALLRARRRGIVAMDGVEKLARAIAHGVDLDFDEDLSPASQGELRAAAAAMLEAFGVPPERKRKARADA